jgi:hypothetical protein
MPSPQTSQDTEKPFPDKLVSQKCPTLQSEPKSGTLWGQEVGHFSSLLADGQIVTETKLFDFGLPNLNLKTGKQL